MHKGLRFMCTFRFKLWWMTQRMGSYGKEIPYETQFLIVEGNDGSHLEDEHEIGQSSVYTVFLPLVEDAFRAVLQGNENDELEICLESGCPAVQRFEGTHLVLMAAGNDPFVVITSAVKMVERHLQTFSHREEKKMPDILNWFGWCTWDAFYTQVSAEGVRQGLESLEKGGISAKFVIIDDGWQTVDMDASGVAYESDSAANFANRLTNIKENHKFQKNGKEGHRQEDPALGLAYVVSEIKDKHKLNSKRTVVVRASDDFFPRDPASHTTHIASVAYNNVFLGEFMQPNWDMFHSLHPMAEYHGAARAVGGCAIYVSDKPGNHDFNLLKKLVLPDGSILRGKLPGRPTRDCLFADPARDGKSLLKIWILNDRCGVIGVFNCQGAGWCMLAKKNLIHNDQLGMITGVIHSKDVEYLSRVADEDWKGEELTYLAKDASLPVTLNSCEYEIFTVVPIKEFSNGASFAPVGLIKMFNSGIVGCSSWIY